MNSNDPTPKEKILSIFLLGFTCLFFSSTEVVSKTLDFNFWTLTINRFLMGTILLLPFGLKNIKTVKFNDLVFIFLNGNFLIISMLFLQLAVEKGEASLAALLISTNIIFVAFFSSFLFKTDSSLSFYKFFLLLVGIGGVILFVKNDLADLSWETILYGGLAALLFGLFTALNKKLLIKYDQFSLNILLFISGLIVLIPTALVFGDFKFDYFLGISDPSVYFRLLYLGIGVTGLAYIFYFYGLKYNSAVKASFIYYIKPFLSYGFAILLLGQTFDLVKISGLILVFFAIILYGNKKVEFFFHSLIKMKNRNKNLNN